MGGSSVLHETEESMAARKAFNAKRGGIQRGSISLPPHIVMMPLPAGTIHVDITELSGNDWDGAPSLAAPSLSAQLAEYSNSPTKMSMNSTWAAFSSAWRSDKLGAPRLTYGSSVSSTGVSSPNSASYSVSRSGSRVRKSALVRLAKRSSYTSEGSERSLSVKMAGVREALTEAEQASRSLREPAVEPWALHDVKPLECRPRNAETAKSLATETARAHEERYERELAVRQMWRTMMGEDTPGLEAEISKMRATEQAKYRYREWELEYQQKHGRRATTRTAAVAAVAPAREEPAVSVPPLPTWRSARSEFKFDKRTFFATSDWLLGLGDRPEYTKHLVQVRRKASFVSKRTSTTPVDSNVADVSPTRSVRNERGRKPSRSRLRGTTTRI